MVKTTPNENPPRQRRFATCFIFIVGLCSILMVSTISRIRRMQGRGANVKSLLSVRAEAIL